MERIMKAQAHANTNDAMSEFYLKQKKALELNPRHPVIKELLRRVSSGEDSEGTRNISHLLYETAVLRSGFALKDESAFASRIEDVVRMGLNVDRDAAVEEEKVYTRAAEPKHDDDDEEEDVVNEEL